MTFVQDYFLNMEFILNYYMTEKKLPVLTLSFINIHARLHSLIRFHVGT